MGDVADLGHRLASVRDGDRHSGANLPDDLGEPRLCFVDRVRDRHDASLASQAGVMETAVGSADEPAASSVRAASAGRYRPPRYAKRMHSCATPRSFLARNRRAALADRTRCMWRQSVEAGRGSGRTEHTRLRPSVSQPGERGHATCGPGRPGAARMAQARAVWGRKGLRPVTVPYIRPCWKSSDSSSAIPLTSAWAHRCASNQDRPHVAAPRRAIRSTASSG